MERKNVCLKNMGILLMQSACPVECPVIKQASDEIWQARCISKEGQESIAMVVGEVMRCPNIGQIVLPRGSQRMR